MYIYFPSYIQILEGFKAWNLLKSVNNGPLRIYTQPTPPKYTHSLSVYTLCGRGRDGEWIRDYAIWPETTVRLNDHFIHWTRRLKGCAIRWTSKSMVPHIMSYFGSKKCTRDWTTTQNKLRCWTTSLLTFSKDYARTEFLNCYDFAYIDYNIDFAHTDYNSQKSTETGN